MEAPVKGAAAAKEVGGAAAPAGTGKPSAKAGGKASDASMLELMNIDMSSTARVDVDTNDLIDIGELQMDDIDLNDDEIDGFFSPSAGAGSKGGGMEDLGDIAGYEAGRSRSDRFGLGYLRLNRPLKSGMLVTIEPGFYQVPAILNDSDFRTKYQDVVNWERLAQFDDVRGIRIEDDVLITDSGAEVLTAQLPTKIEDIENLML